MIFFCFKYNIHSQKSIDVYILYCKCNPLATNQTKIPYPKPLKHLNKTKLRLNESKNNSLKIYFLVN